MIPQGEIGQEEGTLRSVIDLYREGGGWGGGGPDIPHNTSLVRSFPREQDLPFEVGWVRIDLQYLGSWFPVDGKIRGVGKGLETVFICHHEGNGVIARCEIRGQETVTWAFIQDSVQGRIPSIF